MTYSFTPQLEYLTNLHSTMPCPGILFRSFRCVHLDTVPVHSGVIRGLRRTAPVKLTMAAGYVTALSDHRALFLGISTRGEERERQPSQAHPPEE
jgi:hypothetical protein